MPYKHVVHLYSFINVKTLVVKETCLRIKEKMDDTMNAKLACYSLSEYSNFGQNGGDDYLSVNM